MLSNTDRDDVSRSFADAVFGRPNITATLNLDDIRAEVLAICTAIDGGVDPIHTAAFAENVDWIATITDLIGAKL